jgi:hypothetical protein
MKKKLNVFLSSVVILSLALLIWRCGEDVNAPQDFIKGTITFKDTNFNFNGGYYAVSIYGDNTFVQVPIRSDSLAISIQGGVATAYYNLSGLASATYYVGATWIRRSDNSVRGVLGTFGCDTVRGCTSHTGVVVPNFAGTGNINFYSWTDTTRRLYP